MNCADDEISAVEIFKKYCLKFYTTFSAGKQQMSENFLSPEVN
jgi:hypothetical protein